jgi:tRNA-dihydrouridine synthase 3
MKNHDTHGSYKLLLHVLQGKEILLTAQERIGVYRHFVSYMKDYFQDDARGKRSAFYFLPWHFEFFCRYRPLPKHIYCDGCMSNELPLISQRRGLYAAEVCYQQRCPELLV